MKKMAKTLLVVGLMGVCFGSAACQQTTAAEERPDVNNPYPKSLSEQRQFGSGPPGAAMPANGGLWQPPIQKQYTSDEP